MRLAMDVVQRLRRGSLGKAVDLAGGLVVPVAQIADPVLSLHLEVARMCLPDAVSGESGDGAMGVEVERHLVLRLCDPRNCWWLADGEGTAKGRGDQTAASPAPVR